MKKIEKMYMTLLATALLLVLVLVMYIISTKYEPARETGTEPEKAAVETKVSGERITKAEAIRLFSYFFYTDTERKRLDDKNEFTDTDGTWYETYVNAAVHAGYLVPAQRALYAENNLKCGEFRDMLLRVCAKSKISFEDLMLKLPEHLKTVKNKDELLLKEFLQIYYLCMEAASKREEGSGKLPVERTSFLVLNVKETEGKTCFVTESGEQFDCGRMQDYADVFSAAPEGETKEAENREETGFRAYPDATQYLYLLPEVLYCGREIVFISGFDDRAVTIPNALVVYGKEDTLDCYINGDGRKLNCAFPLQETIEKQVADITMQNRKVVSITVKPDTIRGKVLLTGDGQIEVEGYGMLPLQEDYRIYKLYWKFAMEQTNSILVGYENVTFVVEGNEICAALIREAIKAENIRVLISVDRTANYLHDKVVLSSKDAFTSSVGDVVREHLPGEELVLDYAVLKESKERVVVQSGVESGKITVNSIRRSYGIPGYRGSIEVAAGDGGLVIVNELPIEEYLYSVVPSEMPVSHGEEALKVQAVCARSYAYQQLLANRYAGYGAHIDDTVNCQVYNNAAETQSSVFAVNDTYGQIMLYEGAPVTAFYFSTSSGYTSSIEEVWQDYAPAEHFSGKIQLTEDSKKALFREALEKGMEETQEQLLEYIDLSDEDAFRNFIREEILTIEKDGKQLQKQVRTYDSEFSWYRWQVTMNAKELSEQVNRLLVEQKLASDTKPVGTILAIEPVSRAKSGMLTEILIRGTENTVSVRSQTNIRTLLAPLHTTVYLANDARVEGFSLMPSAFFYVEPGSKDGENVFVFYGGGYGHGVGMSQNGVKSLAQAGYTYEEILEHYYRGIIIGFIY